MTSPTGVASGSHPAATTRVRTSRSEKIPARRSPSRTGTAPIFLSAISRAAFLTCIVRPTVTVSRSPMIVLIDFMGQTLLHRWRYSTPRGIRVLHFAR
jgi:hypothetical protein